MGRKAKTDGTKLKFVQLPIMERDLKKISLPQLEILFKKMIIKAIHDIDKGKVPNQINLIDSIAEIEQQIK